MKEDLNKDEDLHNIESNFNEKKEKNIAQMQIDLEITDEDINEQN